MDCAGSALRPPTWQRRKAVDGAVRPLARSGVSPCGDGNARQHIAGQHYKDAGGFWSDGAPGCRRRGRLAGAGRLRSRSRLFFSLVSGFGRGGRCAAPVSVDESALMRTDLKFTLDHWREPCFDLWEEELGLHYYTLRVSAAALSEGAAWLQANGDRREAQRCRADAAAILRELDGYWLPEQQYYRSRVASAGRSAKELDIAVILAAIHVGATGDPHSVHDPRMQKTLARLEALFDAAYPINQGRPPQTRPAMGRYAGDIYYSGGAYYFS